MRRIWAIDTDLYQKLGKQMRMIRQERKISLQELSDKTGIPRSTITMVELGQIRLRKEYWEKLAPLLGVEKQLKVSVEVVTADA